MGARWSNATYPLDRMKEELAGDHEWAPLYPEDLNAMTEQQIRDLYADYFSE